MFTAEGELGSTNGRSQPLYFGIIGVEKRIVFAGLIAEQFLLGCDIISIRSIAVEMVVTEVEENTDKRFKVADSLQLETAYLGDDIIFMVTVEDIFNERIPYVTAQECSLA